MTTRISTGTTVHTTSSSRLWVVFDGVGFFDSRNFTTVMTSRARTNSEISVMTMSSRSWNSSTCSITGVAAFWKPICHGSGWAAKAAPEAASAPAAVRPPQRAGKAARRAGR